MTQELKDIDSLIVKYLDNDATCDEQIMLKMWINISQDNKRYFTQMVKTWEHSRIYLQDDNFIGERYARFKQLLFKRKMRRLVYATSSVAAVTLLLLVIRFLLPISDASLLSDVAFEQKKEVVLPDGSIVWLNKNSRIQYPEDFVSNRKVYLTGEAYFDVIKNKKQPFVVESPSLTIKVLGTRFVVTDYCEENVVETVLESGAIQLTTQKSGEEYLLRPCQLLSYDRASGSTKLESVDAHNFTDWIKNSLEFENSRLKDVFIQLEKWYGITIECDDACILQTPVSFKVDTETKEEILNKLRIVVPFSWKQKPEKEKMSSVIIVTPEK